MLSKKLIKDIQSLGLKKHRQESGLFVAEGDKIVSELMEAAPNQIEGIYAVENWKRQNEKAGLPVELITEEELQRISGQKTPNEVVAVLRQFQSELPASNESALYLDRIQDPGNFGTIVRVADWFGIRHVVASAGCADLYNAKVVQSSMASIARVNVWYDESEDFLAKQQLPVLAAVLKGKSIFEISKWEKFILLIGNESKGIGERSLSQATELITIPRIGEAESLNAAVATGIILSHIS